MINTEYGGKSAAEAEQQRISEFREAAGHVFSEHMIEEMRERGFFLCPASLGRHGDHIGGLYDHSMQVFRALDHFTKQLGLIWDCLYPLSHGGIHG